MDLIRKLANAHNEGCAMYCTPLHDEMKIEEVAKILPKLHMNVLIFQKGIVACFVFEPGLQKLFIEMEAR